MKFQIDFNDTHYQNDDLLIKLGAKLVPTGSTKYPPFEVFQIEITSLDKLKDITETIDDELYAISSLVISFDPATIFIDFMEKKRY